VNEAREEVVAIDVRGKQPVCDAALWLTTDRFDDPTIEAFDEPVGLWAVRSCQTMINAVLSTDEIKGMPPRGAIGGLVLHVDRKAIGELTAIVCEDGVNTMREVGKEPVEEARGGLSITLGMNLQIDVARGAVDRDKGVALAPLQSRQMLQIDVNEADGRLLKTADRRGSRLGPPMKAVTDQTAMNGATRQRNVDAALHHLRDIVQRQLQVGPQFTNQRLIHRRQAGGQRLRGVRSIIDGGAIAPTTNGGLAHPQFGRQLHNRFLAALNVGTNLRCGRGIGVQAQLHDARRSLTYEMPRSTPIPSNQSPGTKHFRGGERG
jgi:hypothetical protein